MRRLWMRFLDWFWMRRIYVGYDPASGDDFSSTVVMKSERDGSFTILDATWDKARKDA